MNADYLDLIAEFLSCYVETIDGDCIPANPIYIRAAVDVLIAEGIFTADELKVEALKQFNVMIPDRFFPQED